MEAILTRPAEDLGFALFEHLISNNSSTLLRLQLSVPIIDARLANLLKNCSKLQHLGCNWVAGNESVMFQSFPNLESLAVKGASTTQISTILSSNAVPLFHSI